VWPASGSSSSGPVDAGGSWEAGTIEVSDAGTANLAYNVIAAAYSRAIDSIVIVTDTGNAVHLVDPHTLVDVSLSLPLTPASVAVSPDGTHAAVGHNGFISYVDLQARTVPSTWNVPAPFGAVSLSNTYVYGIPSSDQWVSLYSVAISTGTVTQSNQNFTWSGSQMAMSPGGQTLYSVDVGLDPESLYSYSLADPAHPSQTTMYFGDQQSPCGIMWISKDGSRLYTGCGYVFNSNGLTYFGELSSANQFVAGVDDESSDGTVAVLGSGSAQAGAATQLQLYESQFLTLKTALSLPAVATPGGTAPSDGRYVFHDAAGTSTFAIVHATDPSSQVGVFAIAKLQ
jgi:chitinase